MSFAHNLRKKNVRAIHELPVQTSLVLILDDVYDTFNVGGMYRVGDAAGVSHIYHCGGTPMPPDPKIARSSVGLWQYIPQSHHDSTLELITQLKKDGYTIVALEQDERAQDFDTVTYPEKIALIAGNETFGVHKTVCDSADSIVSLPMHGINHSLNVVVATGIVLYQIRRSWDRR